MECPLSAVTNHFELGGQSKVVGPGVILSILVAVSCKKAPVRLISEAPNIGKGVRRPGAEPSAGAMNCKPAYSTGLDS